MTKKMEPQKNNYKLAHQVWRYACKSARFGAANVTQTEVKAAAREIVPRGRRGRIVEMAWDIVRPLRRGTPPDALSLDQRLCTHLVRLASRACPGNQHSAAGDLTIADAYCTSRRDGLWLVHDEHWYEYSRRAGTRYVRASWLAGRDPSQRCEWHQLDPDVKVKNHPCGCGYFARRVPGTITTVEDALKWLEPVEVRRARESGADVIRVGDVYLIPSRRDDLRRLPSGHDWDPQTRTLIHREHDPITVDGPVRAIPQRALSTGVGGD